MTSSEFDSLRLNFMFKFSDATYKLCQKLRLGSSYDELFYKLLVLKGYIEIMMEYVPETAAHDSRNFFKRDEMQVILQKMNELCLTSFYVDFILTE